MAERLETYKNAASHGYIANCFQVAMFFQSIAHSCSEKAYTAKTTSAADPHVTDKAELDEQMRSSRKR